MTEAARPPDDLGPAERRRSPRSRIVLRCLARPAGRQPPAHPADRPEGWRCIAYDVSATGVGVALPFRPAVGTELEVEPWNVPGAGPVLARVVHAHPLEHLWLCGCELAAPLSNPELRAWVATGEVPWPAARHPDQPVASAPAGG